MALVMNCDLLSTLLLDLGDGKWYRLRTLLENPKNSAWYTIGPWCVLAVMRRKAVTENILGH